MTERTDAAVAFGRTAGLAARRFVTVHVLVPGEWTVQRGHQLLERMEADIGRVVPNVSVLTHVESLDDPASWDDIALDRSTAPPEDEVSPGSIHCPCWRAQRRT